jgi:hypothetical protein
MEDGDRASSIAFFVSWRRREVFGMGEEFFGIAEQVFGMREGVRRGAGTVQRDASARIGGSFWPFASRVFTVDLL